MAFAEKSHIDVAFLDVAMPGANGVELARHLMLYQPRINIIFTTGFGQYRDSAFDLHASGYLMKPIFPDMIQEELDNLRHPIQMESSKKLQVKTFGNFEVYLNGEPMTFHYRKTKELLAYLIDREGAVCTNKELMSVLWESDEPHLSYIQKIRKELQTALEEADCADVFVNKWGGCGINPDQIDCDYYDWIAGKAYAINAYRGEYMAQYSWAEITHGSLEYATRKNNEKNR